MEREFSGVEREDRAVCTSSLSAVDGESNSVVEGDTESRVGFFTALTTVEKVRLQKVHGREHR